MTNFINTTQPEFLDASSVGRTSSKVFVDAFMGRDPTPQDINYQTQAKWLNTVTDTLWMLKGFTSNAGVLLAIWIEIGHTSVTVETLTGNDGIIVPPTANNINVFGDLTTITTTGNAATSTLTIHAGPNVATTYVENVGSATPALNILNVLGDLTTISTSGAGNTITISGIAFPPFAFNYVQVNNAASPYTVLSTDYYIACLTSTGLITIKLPNAPAAKRLFVIKDHDGSASASNISVTTVGGAVTIDGMTTYPIASNYGAINLLFNGTSYEVY